MIVRAAVAADASSVLDLEADLFGDEAWSLPSVVEELTGPHRHAVVAVDDGTVLGYATAMRVGEVADLRRIGVGVDHQRQGVAAALLAALLDRAAADGADRMLLEVSDRNAAARTFYAAHGFTAIDARRRYYRDGSDAVVMSRPLTSRADPKGRA